MCEGKSGEEHHKTVCGFWASIRSVVSRGMNFGDYLPIISTPQSQSQSQSPIPGPCPFPDSIQAFRVHMCLLMWGECTSLFIHLFWYRGAHHEASFREAHVAWSDEVRSEFAICATSCKP